MKYLYVYMMGGINALMVVRKAFAAFADQMAVLNKATELEKAGGRKHRSE